MLLDEVNTSHPAGTGVPRHGSPFHLRILVHDPKLRKLVRALPSDVSIIGSAGAAPSNADLTGMIGMARASKPSLVEPLRVIIGQRTALGEAPDLAPADAPGEPRSLPPQPMMSTGASAHPHTNDTSVSSPGHAAVIMSSEGLLDLRKRLRNLVVSLAQPTTIWNGAVKCPEKVWLRARCGCVVFSGLHVVGVWVGWWWEGVW